MRQQRRALDVARRVEQHQALVADGLVGLLERGDLQRARRFLAGRVAQDHLQFDLAVTEAEVRPVRTGRDLEALFLR